MYKKIYINMLTQKDELAVAKTHHDIESLNLRPFSTIDEQSRHTMVPFKTWTVLYNDATNRLSSVPINKQVLTLLFSMMN